jgi:dolichyl-phosphate beta-glucosyltransferase
MVQLTRRVLVISSVRDTQCGFKVFRRSLAKTVFSQTLIRSFAFDIEVLFVAHRCGARIVELPVRTTFRAESTFNVRKHLPQFLRDIVQIRMNDVAGRYHC